MPNIDKHPVGDFCWIELATSDQPAAKKFYEPLLGWTSNDFPMGPGDFYTMFSLERRNTGAAYTLRQDQKSHGVPPNWKLYIAVESADATAAKAVQLGGKIIAPAMDVMDAGRM